MAYRKSVSRVLALVSAGIVAAPASAATKDWEVSRGGSFTRGDNWRDQSPPGAADTVRFDLSSSYTVRLGGSRTNARLLVGDDKLLFDLNGHNYSLTSRRKPSITMGLGSGDAARLTVREGTLTGIAGVLGAARGSFGRVTISRDATWLNSGAITVGNAGRGNLTIARGGDVESRVGRVGTKRNARGTATISGLSSAWNVDAKLLVGGSGSGIGRLAVRNNAVVEAGGRVDVRPGSRLTINRGTLTAGQLTSRGQVRFLAGTLNITNADLAIGPAGPLGANVRLTTAHTVNVSQDANVNDASLLLLEGGRFHATQTNNNGEIRLGHADGVLAGNLLFNQGLVGGTGRIDAAVDNRASGELRVGATDQLLFGQEVANAGQVTLLGGTVDFSQRLANAASGVLSGFGTLQCDGGLANLGQVSFHDGPAHLIGDVSNAPGGRLLVSGPTARIEGDLLHDGADIRVLTGSLLALQGDVTGSGDFSGGGTVRFEETFAPTGGDATFFDTAVVFAPGAALLLDLVSPETFDRLSITGTAELGIIDLTLDGAYSPQLGDRFTLVSADHITYGGEIRLPALNNGLSFNVMRGEQALLVSVVPEPGAIPLLALALGLAGRRRRSVSAVA